MYVAIRGERTTYVGVSIKSDICDRLVAPEDCLEEENLPVCRGKRGSGSLFVFDDLSQAADLAQAERSSFPKKITMESLADEVVPLLEDICGYAKNKKGRRIGFVTAVATKDALYEIDTEGNVLGDDLIASAFDRIVKSSYASTEGLPATERILAAFRAVEDTTFMSLFPIVVYDAGTGKRKIYTK